MDNREIIDFIDEYEADKKYKLDVFIARVKVIAKRFWYCPFLLSIPTFLGIFAHPSLFLLYLFSVLVFIDFVFAFNEWKHFNYLVGRQYEKDSTKAKYKLLKKKEGDIRQTLRLEELVKEKELIDKAIAKLEGE